MNISTKNLEVHSINNEEDIIKYKFHLDTIEPNNPYYRFELLNVDLEGRGDLMYFVYSIDEKSLILMPFYLKKISINGHETGAFDVSSPYGYTGPLYNNNDTIQMLPEFWNDVDSWYKQNRVVTEFVRFNFSGNHKLYSGTAIHTLSNVRGKILEHDILWSSFNRSVRKNYNKALENNLEYKMFHESIGSEEVKEFYAIYIGTMNRHDAKDNFYHSMEYFLNFVLSNKKHCAIATVYKNDIPISTELVLLSNDTMYSFLGGTNADYFNVRPNDFLKIKTLDWARKQGYDYYVIGGGLSDGDGLYKYKKKFFPKEEDIFFYSGRKVLNEDLYKELNSKLNKDLEIENNLEDISIGFFPKYRS